MKTIRIAVTGGRDHEITYKEEYTFAMILGEEFRRVFLAATEEKELATLVVRYGDAPGVDRRAAQLAAVWGYATDPIPAPWDPMKKLLGEADSRWKAAGNIRNWQLLQAADLLIAFPGGRGTDDCVRQARELGVRVVEIADPSTVPEKYRIEPDGTEDLT